MVSIEDIRTVLADEKALLIHFNTPMSRHEIGYPEDLRDALANQDWEMCYSTLLSTDQGPSQNPAEAAVCGSVGIVVDLVATTSLISVNNSDGGSNGRTSASGLGCEPSIQRCRDSILHRPEGHNEWYLSGAMPVGIFSFPQPNVFRQEVREVPYELAKVATDFPSQRIFTVHDGKFWELDRPSGQWVIRQYPEIIPP